MIGDLLAQITGEGGTATATTSSPSSSSHPVQQPPKRKANDDLPRASAAKTPRTTSISSTGGPADSHARNGPRPAPPATLRQSLDVRAKPSPSTSSHVSEPPAGRLTAPRLGHPSSKPMSSSSSSRPGSAPSRYLPSTSSLNRNAQSKPASAAASSSSSAAPKAAPKKGSYLEIMQRAKAAQANLGQVGKIQHKPLEKGPTKRERLATQADGARGSTSKNGRAGKPASGNTSNGRPDMSRPLPGSREARNATTHHAGRAAAGKKEPAPPANGRRKAAATNGEEKEKVKKAAVATTGYQGTARPRPSSSSMAGSSSRAGGSAGASESRAGQRGSAGRPRMPFGGPRRSRYDDDDDEMDDFIEYDEEDSADMGGGRRRGWTSDDDGGVDDYDESDMEAGMSDIDEEEQLAERVARREDAQQEALERKLKAEKEQRKRMAMRR